MTGPRIGAVAGAWVVALVLASCTPTAANPSAAASADPLAAAKACAPSGWTAGSFPFGARDYAFGPGTDLGRIRLITPESAAQGKGLSKPGGATFITDWWMVADHDTVTVTFADGRRGTQYRSKSGQEITTEFDGAGGMWQLYARSDEQYDAVLRCLEPKLAGTSAR